MLMTTSLAEKEGKLRARLHESGAMVVALGMSGGVDSSVAARILLDEGYDVIGLTMLI